MKDKSPMEKMSSKKKAWYETSPNIYTRKSLMEQSPTNKGLITHYG